MTTSTMCQIIDLLAADILEQYLEELQTRADGCIRGDTFLIIISCALNRLVE